MKSSGKKRPARAVDTSAPELAFDPIEAALRQIHETIASEDIPDDFLRLLDKLDERKGKSGPGQ